MLSGSSIIVLNYTRYSDSSIIVHGLSEEYGRISFMVYGIGGRHKAKLSAFQPLYLIDAQLYHKAGKGIHKLKEYKINPPLYELSNDIRKSALALFLAELLSKTIREEYADKALFQFLRTSILFLNELDKNLSIYHLVFLLKLSRYLGFAPESNHSNTLYYDYKEGLHVNLLPHHKHYFVRSDFQKVIQLLDVNFNELHEINISKSERNSILSNLMSLYEIHILNFSSLKSYAVLKEVFQ